jgi:hypothetical protein
MVIQLVIIEGINGHYISGSFINGN